MDIWIVDRSDLAHSYTSTIESERTVLPVRSNCCCSGCLPMKGQIVGYIDKREYLNFLEKYETPSDFLSRKMIRKT